MADKSKSKTKEPKKSNKEKSLVIVESPAKAKTIKKILGDSYQIKASVGHIRDLPKKSLGVNTRKNYEPQYEIMPDKTKVVQELCDSAKDATYIYLAPDPDREGEAIAWHIYSILEDFPKDKIFRIEFNAITKNSILEAIKNPREIDMKRVNAQQARRVLDRLVGYKISPLLWTKVQKGLSAGRVQSAAVKIICDREEIIKAFVPEEYWTIHCDLSKVKSSVVFNADLVKYKKEKIAIKNGEEADVITKFLQDKETEFVVDKVTKRKSTRNPQPPFITSTLQREASTKFGYAVKRTMQLAQQLYEGLEIGGEGHMGLITYMRTDSTRIADEAADEAEEYIKNHFGKEFYPATRKTYTKKGKNVQDAHEAIRPSYIDKSPESIKSYLNKDQYRVYKLIWERFMASQMESAIFNTLTNEIAAGDYILKSSNSEVVFKGFLIVYQDTEEEAQDKENQNKVPEMKKGDILKQKKVNPKQHFTQAPPRFTEAALVKTLEEQGIGRPSTYAPIIATIQDRGYVIKEEKNLQPTELGELVNKILVEHFNNIVNANFTATMEENLDKIADESTVWQEVISEFYEPFKATLKEAKNNMEKVQIVSETPCPVCDQMMLVKVSRWGDKFLACPGYPECKKTLPLTKDNKVVEQDKPTDEKCEKCGSDMILKYGPYGQYLKCTNDECKVNKRIVVKVDIPCPKCGKDLLEKKSRYGKKFYGCQGYPDCNFALWNLPVNEKCPECDSILVRKFLKKGTKNACSNKECSYERLIDKEELEREQQEKEKAKEKKDEK